MKIQLCILIESIQIIKERWISHILNLNRKENIRIKNIKKVVTFFYVFYELFLFL